MQRINELIAKLSELEKVKDRNEEKIISLLEKKIIETQSIIVQQEKILAQLSSEESEVDEIKAEEPEVIALPAPAPAAVVEEKKPVIFSEVEIDEDAISTISRASSRSSRSSKSCGQLCPALILQGKRKGEQCGTKPKKGEMYCSRHIGTGEKKKAKEISQVEDLDEEVKQEVVYEDEEVKQVDLLDEIEKMTSVISSKKDNDSLLLGDSSVRNAKNAFKNVYKYFKHTIPTPEALFEYLNAIDDLHKRSKRIGGYISSLKYLGIPVQDSLYNEQRKINMSKDVEREIDKTANQEKLREKAEKVIKKDVAMADMEKSIAVLQKAADKIEQRPDNKILTADLHLYYAKLIYTLFRHGIANRPEDIARTVIVSFAYEVDENDTTYNFFCMETNKWYITHSKTSKPDRPETGKRIYDFNKGLISNDEVKDQKADIHTNGIIETIRELHDKYPLLSINYMAPITDGKQDEKRNMAKYRKQFFGKCYGATKCRHIIACTNFLDDKLTTKDYSTSCMLLGHNIRTQRGPYLAAILKEDEKEEESDSE